MVVLHRASAGSGRPSGRQWLAARGDRSAGPDEPGQLRPAVSFPDVLQVGGLGNLIAAPLQGIPAGKARPCFSTWPRWNPTTTSGHFFHLAEGPGELNRLARKGRLSVGAAGTDRGAVRHGSASRHRGLCTRAEPLGSPGPVNCPQPCWRHSNTRRRCPTRSSTSANGDASPPGTRHDSCAVTTKPSRAGSSCRVG